MWRVPLWDIPTTDAPVSGDSLDGDRCSIQIQRGTGLLDLGFRESRMREIFMSGSTRGESALPIRLLYQLFLDSRSHPSSAEEGNRRVRNLSTFFTAP